MLALSRKLRPPDRGHRRARRRGRRRGDRDGHRPAGPPEVSLELIERWEQGFDVVYAQRRSRQDGAFKVVTARSFYRALRRLSDIDIQRGTKEGDITLKIYDRDDNMVATITDTPSKLQEFALRILQQTTYRLADHEKN